MLSHTYVSHVFIYIQLYIYIYIYIPKHVKLTVSTGRTWYHMKSVDPSRRLVCMAFCQSRRLWRIVQVPQSKTENPNAFCTVFGDPVPILEIVLKRNRCRFHFWEGRGVIFLPKTASIFSSNMFQLLPANWILLAWMFFWGEGCLFFSAKEHIQKGMRHSQLNSCDFILQQLGILRIVLEWPASSSEPSLESLNGSWKISGKPTTPKMPRFPPNKSVTAEY